MKYSIYLIGFLAIGIGLIIFLRQRMKRRCPIQPDIPAFLRKDGANSKDGGLGDPDEEWTEVYRGRKK